MNIHKYRQFLASLKYQSIVDLPRDEDLTIPTGIALRRKVGIPGSEMYIYILIGDSCGFEQMCGYDEDVGRWSERLMDFDGWAWAFNE